MNKSKVLVFGVGVKGSETSRSNGVIIRSYEVWTSMLRRCYSEYTQEIQPAYIGCSVCDEWLSFSTFKIWFDENSVSGYHLDKDLIKRGNKVYCPEFCSFVPPEINQITSIGGTKKRGLLRGIRIRDSGRYQVRVSERGKRIYLGLFDTLKDASKAYSERKNKYIKGVATEYYLNGCINNSVYNSLIDWKVGE